MFSVVALLCSVSLEPSACTRDTAIDSIPLGPAASVADCYMAAQMTLAGLAIEPGRDVYWLIRCERHGRSHPS